MLVSRMSMENDFHRVGAGSSRVMLSASGMTRWRDGMPQACGDTSVGRDTSSRAQT
jgi:hypothetical protein